MMRKGPRERSRSEVGLEELRAQSVKISVLGQVSVCEAKSRALLFSKIVFHFDNSTSSLAKAGNLKKTAPMKWHSANSWQSTVTF